MLRSVFLKGVRDRRRMLGWWAVGMVGVAFMLASFYPTIRATGEDLTTYIENLPEAIRALVLSGGADFTSGPGYLNSELFSFMLPVLVLILGVGLGAGVLAGEEREGRLELLLANPISRRRVVLEKLAAVLTGMLVVGVVLWASLAVGVELWDIPVSHANLAVASLMGVFLGWVFAALALAVGAATGSRGLAIGVAAAVGVGTYFVNGLAPLSSVLRAWQKLTPFYYYNGLEPLRTGFDPVHASVLVVLTALLGLTAVLTFERRDLAV